MGFLTGHSGVEIRYSFGKFYPCVVFCIKHYGISFLLLHILRMLFARYVVGNTSSFSTVTLEMHRNVTFKPAWNLIGRMPVCICCRSVSA
jgi:hypothetical protein